MLQREGATGVEVVAVSKTKLRVRLPGPSSEGGSVADWAWEGVAAACVRAIAARVETLWYETSEASKLQAGGT